MNSREANVECSMPIRSDDITGVCKVIVSNENSGDSLCVDTKY